MGNNARIIFKKLRPDVCMKNKVVHHIDGNRKNNSPGNLVLLTRKEHRFVHVKMGGCKGSKNPKIRLTVENLEHLVKLYNNNLNL